MIFDYKLGDFELNQLWRKFQGCKSFSFHRNPRAPQNPNPSKKSQISKPPGPLHPWKLTWKPQSFFSDVFPFQIGENPRFLALKDPFRKKKHNLNPTWVVESYSCWLNRPLIWKIFATFKLDRETFSGKNIELPATRIREEKHQTWWWTIPWWYYPWVSLKKLTQQKCFRTISWFPTGNRKTAPPKNHPETRSAHLWLHRCLNLREGLEPQGYEG